VKARLAGAIALLLLTGMAGAQDRARFGTRFEPLSAMKDTTAGVVGQLSAELVRSTPAFVNAAAINDLYVTAAGKIAIQRSRSPSVRTFARRMVESHTAALARLKKTIRYNNVNATLPTTVDARRRGMLDDLRGAKAENFDHRYMTQQVASHKEIDILMRRYVKVGKINAMKAFALDTGKTEAAHLYSAQTLDPRTRDAGR
jgi:putative membrane protein